MYAWIFFFSTVFISVFDCLKLKATVDEVAQVGWIVRQIVLFKQTNKVVKVKVCGVVLRAKKEIIYLLWFSRT